MISPQKTNAAMINGSPTHLLKTQSETPEQHDKKVQQRKPLKINALCPDMGHHQSLIKLIPTSPFIRSPLTASPFAFSKRPLAQRTPTLKPFNLDMVDKKSEENKSDKPKEPTSLTFSQLKLVLNDTNSPSKVEKSEAPVKQLRRSSRKAASKSKTASFKMRRFEPESVNPATKSISLECSEKDIKLADE